MDGQPGYRSEHAPSLRRMPTPGELTSRLNTILRDKYSIEPLPEFTIVVEGTTDLDYLHCAVNCANKEYGDNLLHVPSHLGERNAQIAVITPVDVAVLREQGRERGGIKKMVPLAKDLREYVFLLNFFRGIVFVFDHDRAGLEAKDELLKLEYSAERHVLTLDPKHHPNACGKRQVVIEDLLSFRIQEEFFRKGDAWCSVDYEGGVPKRFHWGHESKHALRDYVCERANWCDLREIGRLIARVRTIFGFPVNAPLFDHQ